jgi:hypothetical protein
MFTIVITLPYCVVTGCWLLLGRVRCDLPKVPDGDITPVRTALHFLGKDTRRRVPYATVPWLSLIPLIREISTRRQTILNYSLNVLTLSRQTVRSCLKIGLKRSSKPHSINHLLLPCRTHQQYDNIKTVVTVAIFPGLKRPGREADLSPPSSGEAKKMRNYTFTPPYASLRDVKLSTGATLNQRNLDFDMRG